MSFTLEELARRLECRLQGDPQRPIDGVGTLSAARPGQLSFLTNRRYRQQLRETAASAVIIAEADAADCPVDALVCEDPHVAYARASALFAHAYDPRPGIHPAAVVDAEAHVDPDAEVGAGAVIEAGARVAAGCRIGPNSFVGRNASIGTGTVLVANVSVYHEVTIGARCLLHAGAVVGSDGFGFAEQGRAWVKVHQLGSVRVGDDVEIGANTTIDRGAVDDTVIEDGVKLDNQIQVAHNVRIGAHTAIAGCVGIAGSARIGRFCRIAGGAGIAGHLEIPDGTVVTAMAMVTRTLREPGIYSSGLPVDQHSQFQKNAARFRQLDDMARRIRELEKQLETLKKG